MYNIKDLIINESYGESYMNANILERESESKLNKIQSEVDYSLYRIPFGPDAVHLIQHENNFMVPYADMVKLCKTIGIRNFVEGVKLLSEHYHIPEKRFEIAIEEATEDDLVSIKNDVTDAMNSNIEFSFIDYDEDDETNEDDISLAMMYGEDCDLIKSSDGNGVKDTSSASAIDFRKAKFIKTLSAKDLNFDVSMVNVYNKDFTYYIELSDIQRYMRHEGIESVKEAIFNIKEHNDFNAHFDIKILGKNKGKKAKKKNKKKISLKKNEAMNLIAANNFDKLNLVFISEY